MIEGVLRDFEIYRMSKNEPIKIDFSFDSLTANKVYSHISYVR